MTGSDRAMRILWPCALVTLVDGFDLQLMASATPVVARDWGVPPSDLALPLAAGLFGIAVGAVWGGFLGDRRGRARVILWAMWVVCAGSMLSAAALDVSWLVIARIITGVGLGASMTNAIALVSETVPPGRRARLVTLMFCGVPLGSTFGGVAAAGLMPVAGWRALFLLGAALPIAVWIAIVGRFYGVRSAPQSAGSSSAAQFALLFRNQRTSMTLMLWGLFLGNLFAFYLIASWLPVLLQASGLTLATSQVGAALFQAGGVIGGLLLSWGVDRRGASAVLLPAYALGAAFLWLASGWVEYSTAAALAYATLAGAAVIGCQFCINTVASQCYPDVARSTGVGAAFGLGRLGGILSPLVGAAMLSSPTGSPKDLLVAAASAMIVCLLAMWGLSRVRSIEPRLAR